MSRTSGNSTVPTLFDLGLGGGPWLLVEPPFARTFTRLGPILLDLQRRGHRIVLAHPERCPVFHREPELLEALVDAGALTSLTAGSLVGAFGRDVRRFALELVRTGMAHNVASDAHDELKRPPVIAARARARRARAAGRLADRGGARRDPRRRGDPAAAGGPRRHRKGRRALVAQPPLRRTLWTAGAPDREVLRRAS